MGEGEWRKRLGAQGGRSGSDTCRLTVSCGVILDVTTVSILRHIALLTAFLCAACDGPWQLGAGGIASVRNASDLEEIFAVRRHLAPFACTSAPLGPVFVHRSALTEPEIVTLASGDSVSLKAPNSVATDAGLGLADGGAPSVGATGGPFTCGAAVLLSGRLGAPQLITWNLRIEDRVE